MDFFLASCKIREIPDHKSDIVLSFNSFVADYVSFSTFTVMPEPNKQIVRFFGTGY